MIMKGWKEHGDEICFLTQFQGKIEDYTYVRPVQIGHTKLFNWFNHIYVTKLNKNNPAAKDMCLRYGVPPMKKMRAAIEAFHPDLVILRERSLYTIWTYRICRKLGVRTFLYNLSPVWAEKSWFKDDLPHRIVRKLTPEYRFSPTHQIGYDMTGKVRDSHSYFAPFLVEPKCPPEQKKYFQDGFINIFEIGKYQERKNHFLMVEAVEMLRSKYPDIRLTIAGELSDDFHRDYKKRLEEYIAEHQLNEIVTLKYNLNREEVGKEYLKADLFVVPSTGEPASITVIESMAYSVPSISGTDNGTADYITPGITGEIFRDCDVDDLVAKMDSILSDRNKIPVMGRAGYNYILSRHQFANYYSVISQMIEDSSSGV